MDVKSIFLNGFLEQEISGFIGEGREDKVYKLSKTIYGLKDVPRAWYYLIRLRL